MYNHLSKFKQLILKVVASAFATPAAGTIAVYAKADGIYKIDSTGAEIRIATLPDIQSNAAKSAAAAGTADAITATLSPVPTLTDMMLVYVRASGANTVTNPTFNLNALGALTIYRHGGLALAVGDIKGAGHQLILAYRAAPARWELLNPGAAASFATLTGVPGDNAALTTVLASKADLVGGVIPVAQIPAIALTDYLGQVANQAAMLALVGEPGDWAIRLDTGSTWVLAGPDPSDLGDWVELPVPAPPTYQRLFDENGSYQYAGIAISGELTSDPVWTIRRLEYDVDGEYAGTTEATGVNWDDRLTHVYA